MVVDNLDVPSFCLAPNKAYSPLIIDTNAVLSGAIRMQGFKPVAGRRAEIVENHGRIDGQ